MKANWMASAWTLTVSTTMFGGTERKFYSFRQTEEGCIEASAVKYLTSWTVDGKRGHFVGI